MTHDPFGRLTGEEAAARLATVERPPRDCPPNLEDYDATRAAFAVTVPDRFNAASSLLDPWAEERPEDPAVLSVTPDGATLQTVAMVAAESRMAARALHGLGVGAGDRVMVMLGRDPLWYAAMLGCIRIGAVPVPSPSLLTAKDIRYRAEQCTPMAVITDGAGAGKVDEGGVTAAVKLVVGPARDGWSDFAAACLGAGDGEVPGSPTSADDPLLLYFTSGTVSNPKMVEHQQSYALGHIGTARFWHDLRPGDLHWTVSDTGWAKAAWGGLFGQIHERACIVQVALPRPEPEAILGVLQRYGITSFCAPPTLYRSLVQADLGAFDLSSLRHCTSAGEPLNPEVIRAWRAGTGGLDVYDGYGQSETTCAVANFRSVPVRPGSMGRPMPGYQVAVRDEAGTELPAGEVGEVAIDVEPNRPVGLFHGYRGAEEATRSAFRGSHYFTGDKASVDEDGYLWFEGRGDDVITSSAYRIGPFEVESALIEHAAVLEAAVVGRDDPDRTQIVVALCVLTAEAEPTAELARQLQEHVKATTAPYKYPREVYFVDELPKTVSGKIRRSEIRSRLAAGQVPPAPAS